MGAPPGPLRPGVILRSRRRRGSRAEDWLDDDGVDIGRPVKIAVTLRVRGSAMTFDAMTGDRVALNRLGTWDVRQISIGQPVSPQRHRAPSPTRIHEH